MLSYFLTDMCIYEKAVPCETILAFSPCDDKCWLIMCQLHTDSGTVKLNQLGGTIKLLIVLKECLTVCIIVYQLFLFQSQGKPNFKEGSLYELGGHMPIQAHPWLHHCIQKLLMLHLHGNFSHRITILKFSIQNFME